MYRQSHGIRRLATLAVATTAALTASAAWAGPTHSVARQWNEELLSAIRLDYARPVVHARNLFHVSVAMYDAWAAYDELADSYLTTETLTATDIEKARAEAVSFAAYRVLIARFDESPGSKVSLEAFDDRMDFLTATLEFENNRGFTSTLGDEPAAVGNRCAANVLAAYAEDGAHEADDYANWFYEPVNPALLPQFPGNPDILDPARWQPLALEYYIDQSGHPVPTGYPEFLGAEWGAVVPFALSKDDLTIYERDGDQYWVYLDPGAPPLLGGAGDQDYKDWFAMVSIWSSHLDPADGVDWDISPASIGNAALPKWPDEANDFYLFDGGDWGTGYAVNPATGEPYEEQLVPRGDYARILAEFWADGPESETPPGHWFTILNYVNDHSLFEKRFGGSGPIIDDLEWDMKAYLAMGGAMHDAAVASWGVKGWYDYIRPISAIRHLADLGQSSDPDGPSYDPSGIPLTPGLVEVVTAESTAPGERHELLAGKGGENIGKIAVFAWRGHDYIKDPKVDEAGVGWILAENWWPYQRPSFVTPPFAGYVSGHSTYSRAAAELMTLLTGDAYFPGGLGEFECPQNEFLVFEEGPSVDVTLQWATYRDASDQCSLSRIWGGIHPFADDVPGRIMGEVIGPDAFRHAMDYFNGWTTCPADVVADRDVGFQDLVQMLSYWGECIECVEDIDDDGEVGFADLITLLSSWGSCD